MEAKICPNGSSVGRSGPNCEFAECPPITPEAFPTLKTLTDWQTCTNTKNNFTIEYPKDFNINKTTCDYSIMDYNIVKDIVVTNPIEDLRKNWLLSISVENSNLDEKQWIKSKTCLDSSRCSNPVVGPIENSLQFDLLQVHYAETDTIVKFSNKIFTFSLNARNPNSPLSYEVRKIYNQTLSTFKFIN
jgi:hypothetical protein